MLIFLPLLSLTTHAIMPGIPRSKSGRYLAVVITRPALSPKMILRGAIIHLSDQVHKGKLQRLLTSPPVVHSCCDHR